MNNKLLKVAGITVASTMILAGCSLLNNQSANNTFTNSSSTTQVSSIESVKTDELDAVKKDAQVLFDTIFANQTKGFSTLYGERYETWTDEIYKDATAEWVSSEGYTPESDWTINYYDGDLTPSQVYTQFLETRRSMLQKIGNDYEIKDVVVDGDTATVTVNTKVLNTQRIAQVIRSIRSTLWGDDFELALGQSDNVKAEQLVNLINFYLIGGNWSYKFTALDSEFSVVPVSVSTHDFEVRLNKNAEGDWIISEENYRAFISDTLSQITDYDDWENPEQTSSSL